MGYAAPMDLPDDAPTPDQLREAFAVPTHGEVSLSDYSTATGLYSKSLAKKVIAANAEAIAPLAHKLYAGGERKLLVVLQGMDTSGKDSTVEALFSRTPPLGVGVAAFKAPSKTELAHDYLWRVHQRVPAAGQIVVFNRSHYEDVLVVKVRGFAPEDDVERRYAQINDFERMLTETGTTVLKFMLHQSFEAQGERLRERLEEADKRWKFNPGDLDDRALWPAFMDAYETMLQRTSTEHAPWIVVPADTRKARKAIIGTLVRDALEAMELSYPDPGYRPGDYDIV